MVEPYEIDGLALSSGEADFHRSLIGQALAALASPTDGPEVRKQSEADSMIHQIASDAIDHADWVIRELRLRTHVEPPPPPPPPRWFKLAIGEEAIDKLMSGREPELAGVRFLLGALDTAAVRRRGSKYEDRPVRIDRSLLQTWSLNASAFDKALELGVVVEFPNPDEGDLRWTTEPPTRSGCYWWRNSQNLDHDPVYVWHDGEGGPLVVGDFHDPAPVASIGGEWWPLALPEPFSFRPDKIGTIREGGDDGR